MKKETFAMRLNKPNPSRRTVLDAFNKLAAEAGAETSGHSLESTEVVVYACKINSRVRINPKLPILRLAHYETSQNDLAFCVRMNRRSKIIRGMFHTVGECPFCQYSKDMEGKQFEVKLRAVVDISLNLKVRTFKSELAKSLKDIKKALVESQKNNTRDAVEDQIDWFCDSDYSYIIDVLEVIAMEEDIKIEMEKGD
jgi:hypothetical protein